MSMLDGLRHRLHVLLRGEAYARDVERELRFHVELDALAKDGGIDAELAARRTLGNSTYYREEVRAVTPLAWLDRIRQDASYAWRGLLHTPGFTLTVVATLGLGIGVNAATYSFLDRMFVRPPAGVVDPKGVHRLYIESPALAARGGPGVFGSFSYPGFAAIAERLGETVRVAAYSPSGGTLLRVGEGTDSVRQSFVSTEYFRALRLQPALGRFFAAEESRIAEPTAVAVISDDLWRRSFGSSPAIIGRVIELKTRRFTVVGVAPRDFTGVDANRVDVWLPINSFPVGLYNGRPWYEGTGNYFRMIARADNPEALGKLTAVGSAALRNNPRDIRRDTTASLLTGPLTEAGGPTPLDSNVAVSARVGAISLMVLLIACANVANMLLLRASGRRREIAVRRALGVPTRRLFEQLVTESTMLGMLSGTIALLFAIWAGAALRRLLLPNIHWATAAIDARIAAVTVGLAFLVGFVVGLFPAVMSTAVQLTDALKTGSKQSSGRRTRSVQTALIVVQAALSVMLLIGAGLFVRSFDNVRSIDVGYDQNGLIVANTYVRDETRMRAITASFEQIAERLRARPGVIAVGLSGSTPMAGYAVAPLYVPGQDSAFRLRSGFPSTFYTGPGYFSASGVRVIGGRDFTVDDREGTAPVIVVDEEIARTLWPRESPLGKCLRHGSATAACSTVVGVVEAVHRLQIIESIGPQYYVPYAQHPSVAPGSIIVRADSRASASTLAAMRTELKAILPDQSDWSVRSMGQILEPQIRPWRMGAILFSGLGVLALFVAAIGIYGVVAYAISQRTHEMGVRLALGAQSKDIMDLVVASGLRVVAVGIVLGVIGARLLGRLIASQLFGVVPSDPSVIIAVVATMSAVAGIACVIPGWRAAGVDPATSLRAE